MKSQMLKVAVLCLAVVGSAVEAGAQERSCKAERSASDRSCSTGRADSGGSDRPSQAGSDRGRDSHEWGQNRSVYDPNLNGGVTTEFSKDRQQPSGHVTNVHTRVERGPYTGSGNIAPNRSVYDPSLNRG